MNILANYLIDKNYVSMWLKKMNDRIFTHTQFVWITKEDVFFKTT